MFKLFVTFVLGFGLGVGYRHLLKASPRAREGAKRAADGATQAAAGVKDIAKAAAAAVNDSLNPDPKVDSGQTTQQNEG